MSSGFLPAFIDVPAPGDATPERVHVLLHGIMGSASNWRSFARNLAASHKTSRLLLVDLRRHGDSVGAPPPDTVVACADDVARLCASEGVVPSAIIGHSFGGKVALLAARAMPGVAQVVLVDAPVGPIAAGGPPKDVERVLAALHEVPMPLSSRGDLEPILAARGLSSALIQWMGTNLKTGEGGYLWRFDLAGIEALLADYAQLDLWPLLDDPARGFAITAVRGGRSDRFTPADVARLDALGAAGVIDLHVVPRAGHWVHAEDPGALQQILDQTLPRG